jgi:Leucine-rich repeat (LRR) protein
LIKLTLLLFLTAAELDLTGAWVTDADLAKVAQMPQLRKLSLAHTKITDLGLEYLKDLRNVTELDCYYAEFLTEDGIAHLKGWTQLQRLNLRGTRVTSKVFEHLTHFPNLRWLDLGNTQIDDEGFEQLTSLTHLEHLAIGGNRLNGSGLTYLKLLPSLTDLDVGGIQRVDSGLWGLPLTTENLQRIAELKQLRRLTLARATLSDRGIDRPGNPEAERSEVRDLSPLTRLVNLEVLDVTRLPATEEALRPFSGKPNLRLIGF